MIEVAEALTVLLNLLVAIAAIAGVCVAAQGLTIWKREKAWLRDTELSEELLVLQFKRRHAVSNARSETISYVPAKHDAEGNEIEDPEYSRFLGWQQDYQERLDKLQDIRSEIYGLRLRADALWGPELSELLNKLYSHEQQLIVVIGALVRANNPKLSDARRSSASRHINDSILYEDWDEEDKYALQYEELFRPIENYLREKMRA